MATVRVCAGGLGKTLHTPPHSPMLPCHGSMVLQSARASSNTPNQRTKVVHVPGPADSVKQTKNTDNITRAITRRILESNSHTNCQQRCALHKLALNRIANSFGQSVCMAARFGFAWPRCRIAAGRVGGGSSAEMSDCGWPAWVSVVAVGKYREYPECPGAKAKPWGYLREWHGERVARHDVTRRICPNTDRNQHIANTERNQQRSRHIKSDAGSFRTMTSARRAVRTEAKRAAKRAARRAAKRAASRAAKRAARRAARRAAAATSRA